MFNRNTTRSTPRPKPIKRLCAIDKVALRKAGKVLDKAGTGLFRWMTTDHTHGLPRLLIDKPISGFWAGVGYELKVLLLTIWITVARVLLLTILYLIWIPFMIWLLIYFLTH